MEKEEDICGICRDTLTEPTQIKECLHIFCFSCISKWCNISNSCPLCQTRFLQLSRISSVNRAGVDKTVVSVNEVDRREENWMQVMEQYDSEEQSIYTDTEEEEGSAADRYESDFVSGFDFILLFLFFP